MNCLYLECKNFRDFAEKDRISALLFCEVLNLNFDYFYDLDKQTGYVDGWAFDDIYVFRVSKTLPWNICTVELSKNLCLSMDVIEIFQTRLNTSTLINLETNYLINSMMIASSCFQMVRSSPLVAGGKHELGMRKLR